MKFFKHQHHHHVNSDSPSRFQRFKEEVSLLANDLAGNPPKEFIPEYFDIDGWNAMHAARDAEREASQKLKR